MREASLAEDPPCQLSPWVGGEFEEPWLLGYVAMSRVQCKSYLGLEEPMEPKGNISSKACCVEYKVSPNIRVKF